MGLYKKVVFIPLSSPPAPKGMPADDISQIRRSNTHSAAFCSGSCAAVLQLSHFFVLASVAWCLRCLQLSPSALHGRTSTLGVVALNRNPVKENSNRCHDAGLRLSLASTWAGGRPKSWTSHGRCRGIFGKFNFSGLVG